MVDLIGIRTGKIDPLTPGAKIPAEDWKYLLSARRAHCHDQFQHDCKQLLFFIDDGRANNFFGYADEITYWREGLRLEPEAVSFAQTYLRVHFARLEAGMGGRDWREIPFDRASALGKEYQLIDAMDEPNRRSAGSHGRGRPIDVDNNESDINVYRRPTGTSAAAALRRLRKDRPDIHTRVLAGEMSAHAGMIEAGFRKKRKRKKLSPVDRALRVVAKFTADQYAEFLARLGAIAEDRDRAA
jgi:hypothetical protein